MARDVLGYEIENGMLVRIWQEDGWAFLKGKTDTYRSEVCTVEEAETRHPDWLRRAINPDNG